jgi:hypothetical protein
MQLVLANSETVIVWAASLGLSELQGFEEHAPEYRICTLYAGRLIGKRRPAKGCQERDQRFRIPRGKGNAELAKGQRGRLRVYSGVPGLDVRDCPAAGG